MGDEATSIESPRDDPSREDPPHDLTREDDEIDRLPVWNSMDLPGMDGAEEQEE